jgi:hypothetical protein
MKEKLIQLGIRLDKQTVEEINRIAKNLGYDHNFLIRKMIREELANLRKDIRQEATDDYLDFRITEQEFIDIIDEKPDDDLKNARKENMGMILEQKKEKRKKD